jgi:hypothetical protein
MLLIGSENQQPKNADPIYGPALISPTRKESRVVPFPIPKYSGKLRFAPFEPSHILSELRKENGSEVAGGNLEDMPV